MAKYATGFPAAGTLTGAELLQLVQSGADVQATVSSILSMTAPGANYLINGDMIINQRQFAGGALSAGIYGYDRWKAGAGGCNVSVNTTTQLITHTSGPLVQVMEAPGLAGQTVTVSVEDPSGSITVSVDGVTGSITSGSGRRGVSIAVPSGSTGNVTLTLTATGVTYKRVKLERGVVATPWYYVPYATMLAACQRYLPYFRSISTASILAAGGMANSATLAACVITFPVTTRVPPTGIVFSNATHFAPTNSAGTGVAATSVNIFTANTNSALLSVAVASGLVAGNAANLFFINASAFLYFDGCEL